MSILGGRSHPNIFLNREKIDLFFVSKSNRWQKTDTVPQIMHMMWRGCVYGHCLCLGCVPTNEHKQTTAYLHADHSTPHCFIHVLIAAVM